MRCFFPQNSFSIILRLPPRPPCHRPSSTQFTKTHVAAASPHPHPTVPPIGRSPQRSLLSTPRHSSATATRAEAGAHHCAAIKMGLPTSTPAGNPILDFYCRRGSLDEARKLFDEMSERDVVTWTILIAGYSRRERWSTGLLAFAEMVGSHRRAVPNCFTLASVFRCCSGLGDLTLGKGIHGLVLRRGIGLDTAMENSMVDFYAKCGDIQSAKGVFAGIVEPNVESWNVMISALLLVGDVDRSIELFRKLPTRDVVSWNTIISGQMQSGYDAVALRLLYEMVVEGPEFNHFTLSMSLALAGSLLLKQLGRQVHCSILRSGFECHVHLRNSLVDMYCKCGEIESAKIIFDSMPWFIDNLKEAFVYCNELMEKTVAWSSMIAGCVQNGRDEEAVDLFCRMIRGNFQIDLFTLTSVAAACSNLGILEQGRQVHACIEKLGHEFDVALTSAVTYMYAKCGSLEDARAIFDKSKVHNVVLWTNIIGSFSLFGKGREAMDLFERMLKENVKPNEVTFVNILSACSHAGLVEEGYKYFRAMQDVHGLVPKPEHFTCMVDLLGRAGCLNEAKEFILKNSIANLPTAWRALLSACRVHKDIAMAIWVSAKLVALDPSDPNSYILLSNIYSQKMQWDTASRIRSSMQEKGVMNKPGQSWIQLKGKVHTFVSGDKVHPNMNEINSFLEKLMWRLEEVGYRKDTDLSLHDVEEEERETILNFHSEKLAIAYGIINTPDGVPIRVMKNLRVCCDCHTAIKYISQVTGREIILRDALRFHQFKHGLCSCGDFW